MSNRKRNRIAEVLATGIVVAVIALTAGTLVRNGVGGHTTEALPASAASDSGVTPPQVIAPVDGRVSSIVDNVEVWAENVRLKEGRLLLDACFTLPDNKGWIIEDATVEVGKSVAKLSETYPIEIRGVVSDGQQRIIQWDQAGGHKTTFADADEGAQGYRCDTLYFDIGKLKQGADLSSVKLTVNAIAAAPYEGEQCTPEYLSKVQRELESRMPGVKIACVDETLEGGGGIGGLTVEAVPEGLAPSNVDTLLASNDFYIAVHGIEGPWILNLSGK